MEQRQYTRDEEENWQLHIEVVEHTKSDAGNRTIYVVSSALEISSTLVHSYSSKYVNTE